MLLATAPSRLCVLEHGVEGRPADLRELTDLSLGHAGVNGFVSEAADGQGLAEGDCSCDGDGEVDCYPCIAADALALPGKDA